jgi:hypothetical protein
VSGLHTISSKKCLPGHILNLTREYENVNFLASTLKCQDLYEKLPKGMKAIKKGWVVTYDECLFY